MFDFVWFQSLTLKATFLQELDTRGHIFSNVRPFSERAVSDPDRPMHRSLWVLVAHSLVIEGSHMTKSWLANIYLLKFPFYSLPHDYSFE